MMSILRIDDTWGGLIATPSLFTPISFFLWNPIILIGPKQMTKASFWLMHLVYFLVHFVLTAILTIPSYLRCVSLMIKNKKTNA